MPRLCHYRDDLLHVRTLCTQSIPSHLRNRLDSFGLYTKDSSESIPTKLRKRGKKGGIRKRCQRRGLRLALPTILFGNVQSVNNEVIHVFCVSVKHGLLQTHRIVMLN